VAQDRRSNRVVREESTAGRSQLNAGRDEHEHDGRPLAIRHFVRWFSEQIDEIRSDTALTIYGSALAVANILTCYQWQYRMGVPQLIGGAASPLCWPFWERCHSILSVSGVNRVLWIYLFLSALAAAAFLIRRAAAGYWLLIAITAIRTIVMIQDYRFRANQHYMLNAVLVAFVLLPGKRALLHHVLVSLYFWAGILKVDREWLSGVALYNQDRLWLPAALVPASCVYVVLLETTLVFGIYSRRNWLFWTTLAQLAAFHIFSWPVVGFWYPTLMFCLISILPLSRLVPPVRVPAVAGSFQSTRQRALVFTVVAGLAALQFVPRAFPGDTAITGEGRVFALHMFDALVVCEATLTYRFESGGVRVHALEQTRRMPHRSRCDPVIFFDIAKNTCRQPPAQVVDLDLTLRSKHSTDPEYRTVIDIKNFCVANPTYDMWRHNAWIEPGQPTSAWSGRRAIALSDAQ
jgi:hypothetical protein